MYMEGKTFMKYW